MAYPEGRHTGRQRATLVLKVPSRLRVRTEAGIGQLAITKVAGVETSTTRGGNLTVRDIAGPANIVHRGGRVTIENVEGLKFSGRAIEAEIKNIRGDTSINMDGGSLRVSGTSGAFDVETRNADVELTKLEQAKGQIRINHNGGSISIEGLTSAARVDSRNAEVTVVMGGPAALAIYIEDGGLTLTPPAAAYTLDAIATGGARIGPDDVLKDLGVDTTPPPSEDDEMRASAKVNGGGPTLAIRATRAGVTLRPPGR